MKHIVRFIISRNRSYTMDIDIRNLSEDSILKHPVVSNELQRRNDVIKIEVFKGIPSLTILP